MKYILCLIMSLIISLQVFAVQRHASGSGSPFKFLENNLERKGFYAQQSVDLTWSELQKIGDEIQVYQKEIESLQEQIAFADQRITDFLKDLSTPEKDKKKSLRLLEIALEQKKHCSERYQESNKKLFIAQKKEFNLKNKLIEVRARVKYLPPLKK